MSKLGAFLEKNTITPSAELPLVHTTKGQLLPNIMESGIIDPQDCNVFVGEKLTYLFYGRPSYKISGQSSQAWLMPICFVMSSAALKSVKRILPFDSGAFAAGRHPDYMSSFDMKDFVTDKPADPQRIVGAFFDNVVKYFKIEPKDRQQFATEHSLDILDAQILALRDLAGDSSLIDLDDRRFAIEVQTQDQIDLKAGVVKAVILPYEYLDLKKVADFVVLELRAVPLGYETFGLSSSNHTTVVYTKLLEFLRSEGAF